MRSCKTMLLALAALHVACNGSDGQPGVAETCFDSSGTSHGPCRVFRGRLQLPAADQLHLTASGFQVAAVAFVPSSGAQPPAADGGTANAAEAGATGGDGGPAPTPATDRVEPRLFHGPVFAHEAGAGQRPDLPFSVVVPCALSANLVLQVPCSSDGSQPGLWVAAMAFAGEDGGTASSTLVPRQPIDLCGAKTNSIDLGRVTLRLRSDGVLSSGQITLGKDSSRNPLELLDTDGDGVMDLADTDDDDDGLVDIADVDAEGDGIVDSAQQLTALADQDADGVPDLFQ